MHFELKYKILDRILRHKRISRNSKISTNYSNPSNPPSSTYKNLICITGFGHSGSGTVLDYLSEFNNATVIGFHDPNDSGYKKVNNLEFDLFRCPCGILDIENYLNNDNYFSDNFVLKNFIHTAQYYYLKGGIYNDEFWNLTQQFIEEITEFKLPAMNNKSFEGLYHLGFKSCNHAKYKNIQSPMLINNTVQDYIYYLKNLSKEEYRKIANKYLTNFFKTIESKNYLVFDQLTTNRTPNYEIEKEYLGNFKNICVYRDPRDVFVTGIVKSASWIPKKPEIFVKWYLKRGIKRHLDFKHENKLTLRFEDFVLNYNEIAQKINQFLEIDKTNHVHEKEYFNPEISKKNIGIYRTYHNQEHIKYIEENLKEYCYEQ